MQHDAGAGQPTVQRVKPLCRKEAAPGAYPGAHACHRQCVFVVLLVPSISAAEVRSTTEVVLIIIFCLRLTGRSV